MNMMIITNPPTRTLQCPHRPASRLYPSSLKQVLQTLLALAEFMEHDEKPLPIDIRKLGSVAENCQV